MSFTRAHYIFFNAFGHDSPRGREFTIMATTDLKLDDPGSLPKPGPIGRLVRLALGALCLWYVSGLLQVFDSLVTSDGHIRSLIWNGVLPGLFLVSYVINIGYSRAWKKWPAIVSAVSFLLIGAIGYLTSGSVETSWLAGAIWVWALYVFSHLGVAFMLSGIIGTPGCEMRAFHDLYSRITGVPTKEHFCPVGPLHPIDQWEAGRTHR
jgi:hypothetical protein